MKCESKISKYCRKIFKKSEVKYIWYRGKPIEVCDNCFWLLKQKAKEKGNGGYPTHKSIIKASSKLNTGSPQAKKEKKV